MIKQTRNKKEFPQSEKGSYKKTNKQTKNRCKCHTYVERLSTPLRLGTRKGCLILPLLFNKALEDLARGCKETIEVLQNGKEEVKVSPLREDIILHIENPKEYIHTHTHNIRADKSRKFQNVRSLYKNQLYFHTTMNKLKMKLRKQFYLK